MGFSPLLGVLIGALVTLGMIVMTLVVRARRERMPSDDKSSRPPTDKAVVAELSELSNARHHPYQQQQHRLHSNNHHHHHNQQQYQGQSLEQTVETDPDVIPNKFGKLSLEMYEHYIT